LIHDQIVLHCDSTEYNPYSVKPFLADHHLRGPVPEERQRHDVVMMQIYNQESTSLRAEIQSVRIAASFDQAARSIFVSCVDLVERFVAEVAGGDDGSHLVHLRMMKEGTRAILFGRGAHQSGQ
jgi:hypothetical protein